MARSLFHSLGRSKHRAQPGRKPAHSHSDSWPHGLQLARTTRTTGARGPLPPCCDGAGIVPLPDALASSTPIWKGWQVRRIRPGAAGPGTWSPTWQEIRPGGLHLFGPPSLKDKVASSVQSCHTEGTFLLVTPELPFATIHRSCSRHQLNSGRAISSRKLAARPSSFSQDHFSAQSPRLSGICSPDALNALHSPVSEKPVSQMYCSLLENLF
jgi:hypothetical protein